MVCTSEPVDAHADPLASTPSASAIGTSTVAPRPRPPARLPATTPARAAPSAVRHATTATTTIAHATQSSRARSRAESTTDRYRPHVPDHRDHRHHQGLDREQARREARPIAHQRDGHPGGGEVPERRRRSAGARRPQHPVGQAQREVQPARGEDRSSERPHRPRPRPARRRWLRDGRAAPAPSTSAAPATATSPISGASGSAGRRRATNTAHAAHAATRHPAQHPPGPEGAVLGQRARPTAPRAPRRSTAPPPRSRATSTLDARRGASRSVVRSTGSSSVTTDSVPSRAITRPAARLPAAGARRPDRGSTR